MAWTTSIPVINSSTSEVAYRIAAEVRVCETSQIVEISTRAFGPKRFSWYS